MTLGDRCDEIVRLIDETLADVGSVTITPASAPAGGAAGVPPARPRAVGMTWLTWDDVLARARAGAEGPDREASGF